MKKIYFAGALFLKYLLFMSASTWASIVSGENKGAGNTKISDPVTVLKLSPGENNPRNSEGAFINLRDGRVLFVYSHYTGASSDDHAPAFLAGRYSKDGGKTWTSKDELIVPNEGGMNVMSVSLLRLQNGDIALFYLRKNSTEDCIPLMRISRDESKSWSNPQPIITDRKGYFVLNNDRVIQLKDGRLLMSVALHKTPGGEWKNQADLYTYFSDDNGRSWTSGSKVPNTKDIVTQEPGLVELPDGRIMMYIRASGGFQQVSFSSDRGVTWSHIQSSNIPSPLSPATIKRIPGTDDLLLVWNNNDGSDPEISGKRTPITVAVSDDQGKTWKHIRNISDDSDGWYCYIAIHFVNDTDILLSYCAGSRSHHTELAVTDLMLLHKSWVYK